jgi:cytochrome c-type biogenesis protein CcmE
MASGVGAGIYAGFLRAPDVHYYKHVDELAPPRAPWAKERLYVLGCVTSIEQRAGTNELRILLKSVSPRPVATLVVHHRGPLPDTVRTGHLIVAVGRLDPDGGLLAEPDGFLAKCPVKYSSSDGGDATACH